MKKILIILPAIAILTCRVYGQSESYGRPIAEIFTDFHVNFNDTTKHTGFDLNRAYLGYHFIPGGNLSAKIIINAGSPDDLGSEAVPRRYAYIREASLIWNINRLTVSFGITGTRIFEYQQKFWGKRYVANTYQSINGYGFVADLGIVADYIFNDVLKADISIMNGEGYSNLQLDDNFRTSLGFTITPTKTLAIRLYGDIQKAGEVWQPVLVGFAGFRNDLVTIGGEVSYKSNIDKVQGHHAWGISSTAGIKLTDKMEFFGRYDFISSVVVDDDILKWNYRKDGTFVVTGLQYTLSEYAKMAFNYQGRFPYSGKMAESDMFYVNLLFKF